MCGWVLSLCNLILSLDGQCPNGVEFSDTLLMSENCLLVWGSLHTYIATGSWNNPFWVSSLIKVPCFYCFIRRNKSLPYYNLTWYIFYLKWILYTFHHLFNICLKIIENLSGNINITTTIYHFQIEYSTSLLLTLENCEYNYHRQNLRFSYFSKVLHMWSRD